MMKNILKNNKICAIMRNVPMEIALDYAKAAYRGGIRLFEVALNTPDGAAQITLLRENLGQDVFIGAGTVINEQRCQAAKEAGAQFFLTPSVSVGTLEFCRKYDIPLLPGVLTPTDVAVCLEYGYSIMKLFPASDMPPNYVKSLKGPFDQTEYVAVGGVNPDNISRFLNAGFIGVGIGSNLIPKEYIATKNWAQAERDIAAMVKKSL